MALIKVIRCNKCKNQLVYPKNTRWATIIKTAKNNGWLVGKINQVCPECKADL